MGAVGHCGMQQLLQPKRGDGAPPRLWNVKAGLHQQSGSQVAPCGGGSSAGGRVEAEYTATSLDMSTAM